MAAAAEKRAWLRDNGYDGVPDRGSLPKHLADAYDAAHPGGNGDHPAYPDGMDDAMFGTAEAAEPAPDTGETRPRPVKPPSRGKVAGWRAPWQRRDRRKTKQPRVPVDELITGAWRIMARVARPLPPLQRTLRVQSPVAGLLLEDSIKGTVVDAALQPIARMQARGRTVAALAGPPMLVTAISLHLQRCAAAGQPPNAFFMATAQEMLRESLMIWMDVAGPKFAEVLAREKKFEDSYGQDVDAFMEWLFSMPPATKAEQQAEDEAVRRAQGVKI